MNIKSLVYSLILLLFLSCSDENSSDRVSFYFWKSNVNFNDSFKDVLGKLKSRKIYLHYFDVDRIEADRLNGDGIYPVYVVKSVAEEYNDYEIIPVVYIANKIFKSENIDISDLSDKITQLINQISVNYFGKKPKTVQIDCDWTQSTQALYFNLLQHLKTQFCINVTIRLHQIKYQESTGVPPVDYGTLMLYNVGKLNNDRQNSILDNDIVKQYINRETTYPLHLDIALPIFSQTVVKNNRGEVKLINRSIRNELRNDTHFKQISENCFEVVIDTLFKGFYLSKGYNLKMDEISEREIIRAYSTVKHSKLKMGDCIFYHLDEQILSSIDLEKIVKEL